MALKPPSRRLTRKQQIWAVEYLTHGNASQAARQAGYGTHKRGWENVEKRVAEKFLEELGDTSGTLEAITPDALMAKAMKLLDEAQQEGTQARLIELGMRAKGMFTDKLIVENSGKDTESLLDRLKTRNPELYRIMAEQLGATEH